MFGKNEIVGVKYFKDAEKDQLFVTSMFYTLQGEGPYRGEPAFFIRLAKCNLACSFCDTFFDDGDWMTFDQIEEKIEESLDEFYKKKDMVRPEWTKSIETRTEIPGWVEKVGGELVQAYDITGTKRKMVLVITGGEPTLQANLGPFLTRMNRQFRYTQIETNGIIHQPSIPSETTIVISPKCSEKKGIATKYLKPNMDNLAIANCLKFVMSADEDSPYASIPQWAHDWAATYDRTVFVSPMNIYNDLPAKSKEIRNTSNKIEMTERSMVDEVVSFWEEGLLDMKSNQRNHEYTAEYCIKYGFTFNLQAHLFASVA
jgi:7-carboxy-7-deazaguanine synthase